MPRVVVLDYGSGNLRSAQRALEHVGATVEISAESAVAAQADGLLVPGVGAFAACMAALRASGGAEVITDRVAHERPVLGVCVGMQVLFGSGIEGEQTTPGLGVFDAPVVALDAPVVPHTGWNTVAVAPGSVLFGGLPAAARYYFVHSYAARTATGLVHHAEHGTSFVAAVEHGPVSATQFHPEKSGDAGLTLLANWLTTLS